MSTPPPPQGNAQILERGYRRYNDERLGISATLKALWAYSMQRMLGMRRPVWAKLLPAAVVFISYVPAIVFVGIVALAKNDPQIASSLPSYSDYYGYVVLAVMLFAAFSAPDVLCPDRRTGMLGIYLASPLTRDTYLVGKAAAVFTGLVLVTTGPQLLLLLANSLQGNGVGAGAGSGLMTLRIIGAGFVVAALFTSVTMMISSFTDRKGFASAAIILVFIASGVIGGVLGDSHPSLALIGVATDLPDAITTRTFGVQAHGVTNDVPSAIVWAVGIGVIVACFIVTRVQYSRMQVTR